MGLLATFLNTSFSVVLGVMPYQNIPQLSFNHRLVLHDVPVVLISQGSIYVASGYPSDLKLRYQCLCQSVVMISHTSYHPMHRNPVLLLLPLIHLDFLGM